MTDNSQQDDKPENHVSLTNATDQKLPATLEEPSSKKPHSDNSAKQHGKKPEKKNRAKTGDTVSLLNKIPWVAVVAIVIGCAAGFYAYQNHLQQSTQLAETKQALLQMQQDIQRRMDGVQSTLGEYKSSLTQLNDGLASAQAEAQVERNDLEHKIKQVASQAAEKGRDPLMWRIAEVEYLLSIANQRLILLNDPDTAHTALQDADKRLRSIADPGLTEIRKSIAMEMKELKSIQLPDIAGMAARLTALTQGIEQLPLVNRERVKPVELQKTTEVQSWRQIPKAMWNDIKDMVTVHHTGQAIEPLLPPDEKHFLAQNLGLKLEQARLALLRSDTAVFRSNLNDTKEWVSRYFDPEAAAVGHIMATIHDLQNIELSPPPPDISHSLRQIRRWLAQQKTASFTPALRQTKRSMADSQTTIHKQKVTPVQAKAPKLVPAQQGNPTSADAPSTPPVSNSSQTDGIIAQEAMTVIKPKVNLVEPQKSNEPAATETQPQVADGETVETPTVIQEHKL